MHPPREYGGGGADFGGGLLDERPRLRIGVWGVFVLGATQAFSTSAGLTVKMRFELLLAGLVRDEHQTL
jgi:hypothetical protein